MIPQMCSSENFGNEEFGGRGEINSPQLRNRGVGLRKLVRWIAHEKRLQKISSKNPPSRHPEKKLFNSLRYHIFTIFLRSDCYIITPCIIPHFLGLFECFYSTSFCLFRLPCFLFYLFGFFGTSVLSAKHRNPQNQSPQPTPRKSRAPYQWPSSASCRWCRPR